jgi:hypothetical protein
MGTPFWLATLITGMCYTKCQPEIVIVATMENGLQLLQKVTPSLARVLGSPVTSCLISKCFTTEFRFRGFSGYQNRADTPNDPEEMWLDFNYL